MKNAPIIIPTLSRRDHLERCINSLKQSPYAKETDLLISIDYPPTERYVAGYIKVKEYLDKGIDGFATVRLFYQDKNLGPDENGDFLTDKVAELGYDSFILTEDDNEFSKNFLEYINKGLELFKDDERVMMICGYNKPAEKNNYTNNVEAIYTFTPWGFGTWLEKYTKVIQNVTRENFLRILNDEDMSRRLAFNRADLFRWLFEAAISNPYDKSGLYGRYYKKNGEIAHIDQTIAPIMILEGKFSVCPIVSMVRNWGIDDCSGITQMSNSYMKYEKQEIDTRESFDYIISAPLKPQQFNDNIEDEIISYAPGRRAWTLRKMYKLLGKKPVRLIMKVSYYLSLYKSEAMVRLFGSKALSVSFNKDGLQ